MVYFFVDEEEKYKENQLFSAVNGKVSQSLGFFFFFLNEWAKIWNIFFSYKIKYFKSSAIDTTLLQQNLCDKLLNVGKKWCLLWILIKTSYNLSLNLYC